MALTGRCYCGALHYEAEGEAQFRAECHCRECQYISGGGPNYFMALPKDGFRYTKGEPKRFARDDLETPVTREFCGNCGTHIVSLPQGLDAVILKVGTLDDPATGYGAPKAAIYTIDKQPFHVIPEGMPCFERLPG